VSWEAILAFVSGVGAVLGSAWALRRTRREAERECDRRIDALKEGIEIGEHHE